MKNENDKPPAQRDGERDALNNDVSWLRETFSLPYREGVKEGNERVKDLQAQENARKRAR